MSRRCCSDGAGNVTGSRHARWLTACALAHDETCQCLDKNQQAVMGWASCVVVSSAQGSCFGGNRYQACSDSDGTSPPARFKLTDLRQ